MSHSVPKRASDKNVTISYLAELRLYGRTRGRACQPPSLTVHSVDENAPFITFLSDYGLRDELVGVCHGVIARRCPRARVIDITHEIPPQDVLVGARMLRDTVRFMPPGVHLAVVDPGVGAHGPMARRAVALRTRQEARWLVGPDNGLLAAAADALGGVGEAFDVGASPERLQPVSATFHGRDVFAPVAAALADGASADLVGRPLDPKSLKGLLLPAAGIAQNTLRAHVVGIDRFGNVALDATSAQLETIGLRLASEARIEARGGGCGAIAARDDGDAIAARGGSDAIAARDACGNAIRGHTFADVPPGALLLYEDSREMVALAVNEGSAAQRLGLDYGDQVEVRLA